MMQAAKGRSETDGTYHYTCGKCNGTGQYRGQICDWCCAGDFEAITAKLKSGVRGQQYYSLLKEHLRISGKAMVTEARGNGKISPAYIGYLSLRYRLNFKATWEWLHECCVIRVSYDTIADERGWTVKKVHEAAREKHGQIVEWKPKE